MSRWWSEFGVREAVGPSLAGSPRRRPDRRDYEGVLRRPPTLLQLHPEAEFLVPGLRRPVAVAGAPATSE